MIALLLFQGLLCGIYEVIMKTIKVLLNKYIGTYLSRVVE